MVTALALQLIQCVVKLPMKEEEEDPGPPPETEKEIEREKKRKNKEMVGHSQVLVRLNCHQITSVVAAINRNIKRNHIYLF